ncbi:hypothetical protein [Sediminibacterium soli]|uniref:hypothetical protein n=1 Tax=Sediminibacterium soli TaxID=2698829 RepID=UPI0013795DE4|nr:hypothetical protein [Sediminibacterium soli]NCI47083.1 hypothetical protein [Sediminibacterium soli]
MKKITVIGMLLFAAGVVTNEVKAQPPHAKAWGKRAKEWREDRDDDRDDKGWKRGGYYYYPSANVYFSPVSHRYWYPRNGVWINASILPPSVVVYNQPSYIVYREDDDDIWRDNRAHYRRYYRAVPVYEERYRPVIVTRPGVSVNISARF